MTTRTAGGRTAAPRPRQVEEAYLRAAAKMPPTIFGKVEERAGDGQREFHSVDTLHAHVRDARGLPTGKFRAVKRDRLWVMESGTPRAAEAGGPRGVGPTDRTTLLVNDTTLNNSNKTFTIPAGEDWEIVSIYASLITTATVGNRALGVVLFDDAAGTIGRYSPNALLAASLTGHWSWGPGFDLLTNATLGALCPMISGPLKPGYQIRVLDNSIVDTAADDLTVRILGVQRTR